MHDTIEGKIIRLLGEERTIGDVAKILGINRMTASKYLAVMEAKGSVSRRNVGVAKLFFCAASDGD